MTVRSIKGSFAFRGVANPGSCFSVNPIGSAAAEERGRVSCKLLSNFRVISRRSWRMFFYVFETKGMGRSEDVVGSASLSACCLFK